MAAAERGTCGRILPEDLNAAPRYFQIPVENPFVRKLREDKRNKGADGDFSLSCCQNYV